MHVITIGNIVVCGLFWSFSIFRCSLLSPHPPQFYLPLWSSSRQLLTKTTTSMRNCKTNILPSLPLYPFFPPCLPLLSPSLSSPHPPSLLLLLLLLLLSSFPPFPPSLLLIPPPFPLPAISLCTSPMLPMIHSFPSSPPQLPTTELPVLVRPAPPLRHHLPRLLDCPPPWSLHEP